MGAQMQTTETVTAKFGTTIFAVLLAVDHAAAASAQTVAVSFTVHNSFGAMISLEAASCSPDASISPPFNIADNRTSTFGASAKGGTLLCTVRYKNGANGCQFQLEANVVGRTTTTGFASAGAYRTSGGRPSCAGNGVTHASQETGTFTMQ